MRKPRPELVITAAPEPADAAAPRPVVTAEPEPVVSTGTEPVDPAGAESGTQQPAARKEVKEPSEACPKAARPDSAGHQRPVNLRGSTAKAGASAPPPPASESDAPVLPFITDDLNESAIRRAREVAELLLKQAQKRATLDYGCAKGKAPPQNPPLGLVLHAQQLQSLSPEDHWLAFDPKGQSAQREKVLESVYDPFGPVGNQVLSTKYEGHTLVQRSAHLGLIRELLGSTFADLNLGLTLADPEKLQKITGEIHL